MSHETAVPSGIAAGAVPLPEEMRPRTTRGRRRKWGGMGSAAIPIVNHAHEIVGWTSTAPAVENGRLRHAEAERALRGPIFCTQIALLNPHDICRAGGPANWSGPWRCLALCPLEHAHGLEQAANMMAAAPPGPLHNHPANLGAA